MLFKNLKAYASRHVLACIALCALATPAQALDAPLFFPAGTWDVGSTQLASIRGLQSMKLPCVVSNEFDNGFVIRFSGGGGQMLAMAIDFRQNAFVQGRKYDAMISIGDGYVKQASAAAFTNNTLIFNLRPLNDFYNAVKNGKEMEVEIDGNAMRFSLGKISASYANLESCYAGEKLPVVKPITPPVQTVSADNAPMPVPAVESEPVATAPQPILPPPVTARPLPQNLDEIVENADAAQPPQPAPPSTAVAQVTGVPPTPPLPHEAGRVSHAVPLDDGPMPMPNSPAPVLASAAPMPTPPAPPVVLSQWTAKAGEDIKTVLMRWSGRAGYDLKWEADQPGGTVVQDVALNGNFEQAVSQLMAENSAGTGVTGYVDHSNDTRGLPSNGASVGWNAPAGASIQTVLDQWATRAGVTIVWDSFMNVPLKTAVNNSGSFESAVQSVLDQYASDPSRPVGTLNTDPQTGQKTLMMSMDKSG